MAFPHFRLGLLAGLLVAAGLATPGLSVADDSAQPVLLAGPAAAGP